MFKNRHKLMVYMNKIDYLDLDGNALKTFLTVLEENSVSKAAVRLNVSQSAISHTLEKLRYAFKDPLFVRDGRGIAPTDKGKLLKGPVTQILNELKTLSYEDEFNPCESNLEFTIAANDFAVMFVFPGLLKQLNTDGVNLKFNFVPSGVPSINPLRARSSRCQMLITPALPEGKDFIAEELLESEMVCFYDADYRDPPKTIKEYIDSQYVDVRFGGTESSMMVLQPFDLKLLNTPSVTVSNFGALPPFIKGGELITTQLGLISDYTLQELDSAPLPFPTDPVKLYMVWHQHDDENPAHIWLRKKIKNAFNNLPSITNH